MIEIVEEEAGFAGLRAEWTELLRSSAAESVFLTWEWLYTWWKHLGGRRRLRILLARSGGRLIAIAPLSVRPSMPQRLMPFSCLEFLGTGAVGSDYLDFIARHGDEEEALGILSDFFSEKRLVLEFRQVRRNGSFSERIAGALAERGWSHSAAQIDVCPFIRLDGHSWDSYLASLGSSHRYNFKRRLKNLSKNFVVRFDAARAEDERREVLELLIRLHTRRWRGKGRRGAFYAPELVAFHEELSRIALAEGWLRLMVLRLDDRPVASVYGFKYGPVFYFYQSGFDADYKKHSVGLVTMGLAIRTAIEEGLKEFDLLHGDETYKFLWAAESRSLGRIELYPAHGFGSFCRKMTELSRQSRRVGRSLLGDSLTDRFLEGE